MFQTAFKGSDENALREAARNAVNVFMCWHNAPAAAQAAAIRRLDSGGSPTAQLDPLVARVMVAAIETTNKESLPGDRFVAAAGYLTNRFS